MITQVAAYGWGWVICWLNQRAAEGSRAPSDTYAGADPFLVDRHVGRVALCGSAYPVEHYIPLWLNGEWPDEPRPAERDLLPGPWFDLRPRPGDTLERARNAMTAELDRELMPGHQLPLAASRSVTDALSPHCLAHPT